MFSKIKEWVKVNILNIKPIFKIKIEESWFSKKYYAIKFSNNNGWSWRYLQEEGWDLSSHCDELECRVGYFSLDEVKNLSQKLTSYELCDEYNMKLHEEIAEINSKRRKKYFKDIDDGVEYMKEFNKD
jgi:hypothetical protein